VTTGLPSWSGESALRTTSATRSSRCAIRPDSPFFKGVTTKGDPPVPISRSPHRFLFLGLRSYDWHLTMLLFGLWPLVPLPLGGDLYGTLGIPHWVRCSKAEDCLRIASVVPRVLCGQCFEVAHQPLGCTSFGVCSSSRLARGASCFRYFCRSSAILRQSATSAHAALVGLSQHFLLNGTLF